MENYTISIITQKGCQKCKNLIEQLQKDSIEFSAFDAFSREGKKITSSHLVMFTPTILILSPENNEIARAQTYEELLEIIEGLKK